ncbi:hypothetical protein BJY01DRAFT_223419 [Aspergillus pseudoustus]|uniref:Xylanolytic transcriptional activator regulatory domain-containing protein n=1 Tax=Aspergillus pseudoustus TaxID=1810923 RepID=A0ABR4J6B1_9EURO
MSALERELEQARLTNNRANGEQGGQFHTEIETVDDQSIGRTVNGVHLPCALIKALLTEYYTQYHAYCPILPETNDFVGYSRSSPLLFAAVMITALRRIPEHRSMYLDLVAVAKQLISKCIWPENSDLQTIQALILLCHWPIPFDKNQDPSHSFISQATVIGLRLGLHQDVYNTDFSRGQNINEDQDHLRQCTWVACMILNVSICAQMGVSPTVQFDRGLSQTILATNPVWLPGTLFSQLQIARHALSISSMAMDFVTGTSPLITHFETELRLLEAQFNSSRFVTEKLIVLGTKLMLYICAITASSNHPTTENTPSGLLDPSPSPLLLCRAYFTATAIIETAASFETKRIWRYTPLRLHKIALNALCLLFLVKCSSSAALDSIDRTSLDTAILQGRELFNDLSIVPDDFMARANTAFDRLTTIAASSRFEATSLFLVKSRMGANAAFTAARHAAAPSPLPGLLPTARVERLGDLDTPPGTESRPPLNLDDVFLLDMELGELFGSDFRL